MNNTIFSAGCQGEIGGMHRVVGGKTESGVILSTALNPSFPPALCDLIFESCHITKSYNKEMEMSSPNIKKTRNLAWIIHKIVAKNTYLSENIIGAFQKSYGE